MFDKIKTCCLVTLIVVFSVFSAAGCSDNHNSQQNTDISSQSDVSEIKDYKGYYVDYSEGDISITNYNPDNVLNLPDYQELIVYGDDVTIEQGSEGYCIYIINKENNKDQLYYSADLDLEYNIISESGTLWQTDIEHRKQVTESLIEIMKSVKGNNYE